MRKKRIVFVCRDFCDILKRSCFCSGQTLIESTFSMIVIVALLLSMVKVFFWVGTDLAARAAAHEQTLVTDVPVGSVDINDNYRQIRPVFYEGTPMDAATVNSEIFGPDRLH